MILGEYFFLALLKVQPTMVTDLVSMPDVGVIATASAERDLRFYDTTAQKFELRVMITSLPNAICCMHYKFYQELEKKCKLILGDMNGYVKMIEFYPKDRGPFQSKLGVPLFSSTWEQFMKVNNNISYLILRYCVQICVVNILGFNSIDGNKRISSCTYRMGLASSLLRKNWIFNIRCTMSQIFYDLA